MKQLVEHIQKSIYGPAYYRELLLRPASFSWKYYAALALAVALFSTIVSSIPLVPKVLDATHDFPVAFFAYYPDDLEIHIDKGIVSSNVVEPYFLPVPPELKATTEGPDALQSLAVIDTKTPFSATKWREYKTALWLGRDQVAVDDGKGGVRVEPFSEQWNLSINEGIFRDFELRLRPFYGIAAPVIVLALFLGFFVGLCVNFAYLMFGAALLFFLGRLLKQRWSYGTAYRIGLHAMTLPILLQMLLWGINLEVLHVPFFFTAVMLLVVYANFKGVVSETTPLTPTSSSAPLAPTP